MITKSRIIYPLVIFIAMASAAHAQYGQYGTNGQNSPYTRYGFGQLSDQATGANKAMGGIGIGLRGKAQINAINPASYSAVDSMTFLFDGGITLQNTNFNENGIKKNIRNSSFDYLAMQFRLKKKLGITIGMLPYSKIGYNFSTSETLTNAGDYEDITSTRSYYGEGGLNQVFVGLGYEAFKNFSVGVNASYLYGNLKHTIVSSFSQTSANTTERIYEADIYTYKLDFGLQYSYDINKKWNVTVGGIFSLGHDIGSNARIINASQNNTTSVTVADTTNISRAFQLPYSYGGGITVTYNNKLTLGFDYTLQKYGSTKFFGENRMLCDRIKYAFGLEYLPNSYSRNYLNRIKYKAGAYYSDPYARVDGHPGAREYGVTAGFSLPIGRSLINISGQYVKISPKTAGLLKENRLGVCVGFTFNEAWFKKWKME